MGRMMDGPCFSCHAGCGTTRAVREAGIGQPQEGSNVRPIPVEHSAVTVAAVAHTCSMNVSHEPTEVPVHGHTALAGTVACQGPSTRCLAGAERHPGILKGLNGSGRAGHVGPLHQAAQSIPDEQGGVLPVKLVLRGTGQCDVHRHGPGPLPREKAGPSTRVAYSLHRPRLGFLRSISTASLSGVQPASSTTVPSESETVTTVAHNRLLSSGWLKKKPVGCIHPP